ncbi:MAG: hypothetical protein AB1468_02680, partial [Candidatus Micrarchaeota archaeon]
VDARPSNGGSSRDEERYSELKRIADDLRLTVLRGASSGEIVKIMKVLLKEKKNGAQRVKGIVGAG